MIKKIITGITRGMIILLLPLVILLTLLQLYAFNDEFYIKEYKKYNIENETKMSLKDLERATDKIIRYLQDKEDNLDMKAKVDGVYKEVFGSREKQHMEDVKFLFQRGRLLRDTAALVIPVLFLILYSFRSDKKRYIWSTLLYSSTAPLFLITILLILVLTDFYKYFNLFHEIFFTNDLWILNPKTDILIQMLPLGFFMDITLIVLGWFILILIILGVISVYKLKY